MMMTMNRMMVQWKLIGCLVSSEKRIYILEECYPFVNREDEKGMKRL